MVPEGVLRSPMHDWCVHALVLVSLCTVSTVTLSNASGTMIHQQQLYLAYSACISCKGSTSLFTMAVSLGVLRQIKVCKCAGRCAAGRNRMRNRMRHLLAHGTVLQLMGHQP
jgi:hypothetical protein